MGIVFEGTQRFPNRPIAIKRPNKKPQNRASSQTSDDHGKTHPSTSFPYLMRPSGVHGPVSPLLKGKKQEHSKQATFLCNKVSKLFGRSPMRSLMHIASILSIRYQPENIMLGILEMFILWIGGLHSRTARHRPICWNPRIQSQNALWKTRKLMHAPIYTFSVPPYIIFSQAKQDIRRKISKRS